MRFYISQKLYDFSRENVYADDENKPLTSSSETQESGYELN